MVIKNRDPLCTVAHTAFYLFYRWNIAASTQELTPTGGVLVTWTYEQEISKLV